MLRRTMTGAMALLVLAALAVPALAWTPPNGSGADIIGQPNAAHFPDPLTDPPLNPNGLPTGENLAGVWALWEDEGDTLHVILEVGTSSWDSDGDNNWQGTQWPWNPQSPYPCWVEEPGDLPERYQHSFYEGYMVVVAWTDGCNLFIRWAEEGPGPPQLSCGGWNGVTTVHPPAWAALWPPMPGYDKPDLKVSGLKACYSDATLRLPCLVWTTAWYGNSWTMWTDMSDYCAGTLEPFAEPAPPAPGPAPPPPPISSAPASPGAIGVVASAPGSISAPGAPYYRLVEPGWHLIGAPRDVPISDMAFACDGILKPWKDAASSEWVDSLAHGYTTGTGYYQVGLRTAQPLAREAWTGGEGYWLYSRQPDVVVQWQMPLPPPTS